MEKLSRRNALMGLAAAGAGAAIVVTAKAQGTHDPNLKSQEERREMCSSTLRSPTVSRVWERGLPLTTNVGVS